MSALFFFLTVKSVYGGKKNVIITLYVRCFEKVQSIWNEFLQDRGGGNNIKWGSLFFLVEWFQVIWKLSGETWEALSNLTNEQIDQPGLNSSELYIQYFMHKISTYTYLWKSVYVY